jgi:hypothetical protein
MNVVVSQPMFLPWIGLFEQIALADVYVHYDDVQLPQGRSLTTRVQIKTAQGIHWLTAPLDRDGSGSNINECRYQPGEEWRKRHLQTLRHSYAHAPFGHEMLRLAEAIYGDTSDNVAEFNANAIEQLAAWAQLKTRFVRSSALGIGHRSSERLLAICQRFGADGYITGHGAANYLDHELFDAAGIAVKYMRYKKRPYPKGHGEFTPFVSILEAIANCGEAAVELICSSAVDWREHLNGRV